MNGFQVGGIAMALVSAIWALRTAAAGRISRGVAAGWVVVWGSAGVAIARPDLTVAVARVLGISRGADLVLYLSILAMIAGFFLFYLRMKRLETAITDLVRRIALQDDRADEDGR